MSSAVTIEFIPVDQIGAGEQASSETAPSVLVAFAYVLGLCGVMTLYTIGGRKLMDAVRRRAKGAYVEYGLGVVILLIAAI